MYLRRNDTPSCSSGKHWYVCTSNGLNFEGCCSINPCTIQACPDTPIPSAASESPSQSIVSIGTSPISTKLTQLTQDLIFPIVPDESSLPTSTSTSTSTIFNSRLFSVTVPRSETTTSAPADLQLTAGKSYAPMIAGTVGGLVGFSILGIMTWFLVRMRKQKKEGREVTLSRNEKSRLRISHPFYDQKQAEQMLLTRGSDDVFAEFGGRYKTPPQPPLAIMPPLVEDPQRDTPAPPPTLDTAMEIRHTPSPAPTEDMPLATDPEKAAITPPPVEEHPAYHRLPGQNAEIPAYHPGAPAASPPMTQHPAYHISQIANHPAFRSGPMSQSPPRSNHSSPHRSAHSNSPPLSRSANGSPSKNLLPRRSSEVKEGRTYLDNSTPPSRRSSPSNHVPSRRNTPPNYAPPDSFIPTNYQQSLYTFHQLDTIPSPVVPPVLDRSELPAEVPVSFIMPSPSAIPAPLNLKQRHSSPTLKPITSKFSISRDTREKNKDNQTSLSAKILPIPAISRGNTQTSTYSIPIGLGLSPSRPDFLQTPCATPETPSVPSPAALKPTHHNRNSKDLVLSPGSPSSQEMAGPTGLSLTSPTPSLHLFGQATVARTVGAKMVRIKEHAHSAPYPLPKPTPELQPWPPTEKEEEEAGSTSTEEEQYFHEKEVHGRAFPEEKIVYIPEVGRAGQGQGQGHTHHSHSLPDLRPLRALTTADTPITLQESRITHTPSPRPRQGQTLRTTPNLARAASALDQKWIAELSKKDRWGEKWDQDKTSGKGIWGSGEKESEKEVVGVTPPSRTTAAGLGIGSESPERWSGATMYESTQFRPIDGELMSAVESEHGVLDTARPVTPHRKPLPPLPTTAPAAQPAPEGLGMQFQDSQLNDIVSRRTPAPSTLLLSSPNPSSSSEPQSAIISPRTPGTALHSHFQDDASPHVVSPRTPGTALFPHTPSVRSPQTPRTNTRYPRTPRTPYPQSQVATPMIDEVLSASPDDEIDMRERLEESIILHERQERETPNLPQLTPLTPLSDISLSGWIGGGSWSAR